MGKRHYFNKHEFMQILSLVNTDPYEAENRFITYLELYPEDYTAYTFFASLLVTIRKFEEAEKILEEVEHLVINDRNFMRKKDLVDMYVLNYNYAKVKLLMYQEKYVDVLDNYIQPKNKYYDISTFNIDTLNNNQNFQFVGLIGLKLFCYKKLNKLHINNREKYSYLLRQIIEYNENEFLEHIKKHMNDYNVSNSSFVSNLNVLDIIDEVKKYIPSEKGLCLGFIDNIYNFKYDECGKVNNKMVDYFQVVCIANSQAFITMYPIDYGKYLPYIDLNYMKKQDDLVKVKRKSQIERFNQRFYNN